MGTSYLHTKDKYFCCGCEACVNICPQGAINLFQDGERFRYPAIDLEKCINCGLCLKVCPYEKENIYSIDSKQEFFGGYIKSDRLRKKSSSGGAFRAIVNAFCLENYVIFGAEYDEAFNVRHNYTFDKNDIDRFCGSKYAQSNIRNSYREVKKFLLEGKKVLFSGTPCQIAGLKSYLMKLYDNLLTIDVLCESVPSPLFIEKYIDYTETEQCSKLVNIEYRNKKIGSWSNFCMSLSFDNGKTIYNTRLFNLFYQTWLKQLMSRPSCSNCLFANNNRVGDISLGDLWGIYRFPKKVYGKGDGASLILANTELGREICKKLTPEMEVMPIDKDVAIAYQRPLRMPLSHHKRRKEFISDLRTFPYKQLHKKWYERPSFRQMVLTFVLGNQGRRLIANLRKFISRIL